MDNVAAWATRLLGLAPCESIAVETVRFDTQKLQNPEIRGVEYQQGELFGYEVKEYLLEKCRSQERRCTYCGAQNVALEIDHIKPKSRGDTDRVSNLTMACRDCNEKKGNRPLEEFVKSKTKRQLLLDQVKAPLKDAAAVNSIRYAIGNNLKKLGVPVSFWSGGITKCNRCKQSYPKEHWIDAAWNSRNK